MSYLDPQTAGAGGAGGSITSVWQYDDTTTDADPGSGNFRLNNTTIASATELYIDDESKSGVDFSVVLAALGAGDKIYLQNGEDASEHLLLDVTSVTDVTGYFRIVFTVDASSGPSWTDGKEFGAILFIGITGGGGGSPGGSDTQLQYNNGGAFGGTAEWTFDDASGELTGTDRLIINKTGGQELTFGTTGTPKMILEHDGSNASITVFTGAAFAIQNVVASQIIRIATDDSGGTVRTGIEVGGATPLVELFYNGSSALLTASGGIDIAQGGVRFLERADHGFTPAAGFGELWVRNDNPNVLVFTDDAGTDTVLGGGGGGGVWEQISDTAITAVSQIDITWDETTYVAVRIEIEDLSPDTDAQSLFLRLGHTNGGTIVSTGYDGLYSTMESNSWTDLTPSTEILLGNSLGSAAGETFSASIEIKCFRDANTGAIVEARSLFVNSVANTQCRTIFAWLDTQVAAIDTVRIFVNSGSFDAAGTIKLYGLTE